MSSALVYVIVILAIVAAVGVGAAFLDRRRGRQIERDSAERVRQPQAARRDSPR